jgi:hypothetical protein
MDLDGPTSSPLPDPLPKGEGERPRPGEVVDELKEPHKRLPRQVSLCKSSRFQLIISRG